MQRLVIRWRFSQLSRIAEQWRCRYGGFPNPSRIPSVVLIRTCIRGLYDMSDESSHSLRAGFLSLKVLLLTLVT